MKLSYNSPLILSLALLATIVLIFDQYLPKDIISLYFSSPSTFHLNSVLDYFCSFSYILGHADIEHLASNFTYILLVGPALEEKYGFITLGLLIIVTAVSTSLLNSVFFHESIIGASGIAFMLIILSTFANSRPDAIPLTFVLVIIFFFTKEIVQVAAVHNDVSHFTHIFGGVCGGISGFLLRKKN